MGSLTELVIADIAEAADVARTLSPTEKWKGIDAEGLDQGKLSTLRSIVTNQEYEDDWIDEFRFLAGNQEEGPWVFVVPDALTTGVAQFPERRLKAAAKQWARTEEFQMDEFSLEDIESRLKELYRLFQSAKAAKKSVLMYISLSRP